MDVGYGRRRSSDGGTSPHLERLLAWSLVRSPRTSTGYVVAAIAVVATGAFRVLLVASIVPWLLFIPVGLLVALLLGRGPGIFAALLAAVVAGMSIGSVRSSFWLTGPQWTGSILFVLIACGTALLAAELRAMFARAERLGRGKGAAEASLKAVFENAPVGLSLAAADGGSVLINEQMRRLLGRDISLGGIDRYLGVNAVHADGSPYVLGEYPQVHAIVQGVETHAAPFLIERPDGSRLRSEISSVPLRRADGTITGAVSVIVDVEERELAIERQELLIGELGHRMKNTMAMVQAIVHQTLRSAETLAEARESVASRFEALARGQDLLTSSDWRLAELGTVVHAALASVHHDGRVLIEGDRVEVGARAALSFTLVLHELATNALKYGALSNAAGRVEVRWREESTEAGRHVAFSWIERDGPVVAPPTRKGFGTRLIDSIGRGFGGRSELRHDPNGVTWRTTADTKLLKSS